MFKGNLNQGFLYVFIVVILFVVLSFFVEIPEGNREVLTTAVKTIPEIVSAFKSE